MDRLQKAEAVESLTSRFKKAKAAFLIDFKGLNVEEVTRLRKKLRSVDSEMKVIRNTLARRALKNDQVREAVFEKHLVGTNAFVLAYEDASASAKALADFAKDVEKLQLKVGELDGSTLDTNKIKALGALPSKQVLRAQLLGVLAGPMSKFVGTLAGVPAGFVRVLNAKAQQTQS